MLCLERRAHLCFRPVRHREGRIHAITTDLRGGGGFDALEGNALGEQRVARIGGESIDGFARCIQRSVQGQVYRPLTDYSHVRKPDPVGRQDAGKRMNHHAADAESVGHQAGVLARRAAEGNQRVVRDVVTALDGDLLDGFGHVRDRDGEKPFGDLLRRSPLAGRGLDLNGKACEFLRDDGGIERLVAARAEDSRKKGRLKLAEHQIAICDRERTAAAIAGRPRDRARRLRSHTQPHAVETADRAAPRGDGVDREHRRAHPDARNHRLMGALEGAGIMRDIGRRAAHVEADHPFETRPRRRFGHADHAARRARQHGILAAKGAPRRARRWIA